MSPLYWLPFVVLEYFLCAWMTYKNNSSPNAIWFWLAWAAGAAPVWPIIARYSKDVVRDGLYFDIAMTLVYTSAILYFTKSLSKFGYNQWLGIACAVACIYFFKRGT